MKSFDYDFRFMKAGVNELENYLLSDDTFWPLSIRPNSGEPDYPQLTLGALLLSQARLAAYQKSPAEAAQLDELNHKMDEIRSRWKVAWEKKAKHNYSLRIRMWRDFIEEYRHEPADNADRYRYEVRLRAMITLLKSQVGGRVPAEDELLSILDNFLKTVIVNEDFIWEAELQPGFPKDEYWYLYGRLPSAPLKD